MGSAATGRHRVDSSSPAGFVMLCNNCGFAPCVRACLPAAANRLQGSRYDVFRQRAAGRALPLWLLVCASLTALAPLSIDMYLPSFPTLSADLGVDIGRIQLTLGTFGRPGARQGLLRLMSDRYGRKPPLYVGLGLYAAAAAGCALARDVEALMLFRFLQALGGCAGMVVARAVIRDRLAAHESARAFSSLMLVMGLAPIRRPSSAASSCRRWAGVRSSGCWWRRACPSCGWCTCAWRVAGSGACSAAAARPCARRLWRTAARPRVPRLLLVRRFCRAGMFAYIAGSPSC